MNILTNQIFFTCPLEPFVIRPIVSLHIGNFDMSITVSVIVLAFIAYASYSLAYLLRVKEPSLSDLELSNDVTVIPTRWQSFLEKIHNGILAMVGDNIKDKRAVKFFPILFFIFFFITSMNCIGLIPYSFTLTSHLILTFGLGCAIFIGVTIVGIKKHGIKYLSLLVPQKTQVVLLFLLIPIELISYLFKPISLGLRLFANMMAGHTLLKVVGGFAFTLMAMTTLSFYLSFFTLAVLLLLCVLETAVAVIQAFVFSLLICIYINDALNLH